MQHTTLALPSLIPYNNPAVPSIYTLEGALNYLLYTPIVSTLTVTPNVVEIGVTLNTVNLAWTLNREPITSVNVTDVININKATLSNSTVINNAGLTATKVYILTITDNSNITTKQASISFRYSNYIGKSTLTTLSNSQVLSLSTIELKGSKEGDYIFSDLVNEYIYFVFPASYGVPIFRVNGLNVVFLSTQVPNFTNVSGAIASYTVYRSENQLNGSVVITVL